MAGHRTIIGDTVMFIDYADAVAKAVVNGRTWRWEFHRYCGPTFLKKNGDARKRIPGEHHPVWKAFDKWLQGWLKKHPSKQSPGRGKPIKLDIK